MHKQAYYIEFSKTQTSSGRTVLKKMLILPIDGAVDVYRRENKLLSYNLVMII